MALFSISCPTCRARLKVRQMAAIGQILECPKCGSMVQVTPPPGWQPPAETPKPSKSVRSGSSKSSPKLSSSDSSASSISAKSRKPADSAGQQVPTPQASSDTSHRPTGASDPDGLTADDDTVVEETATSPMALAATASVGINLLDGTPGAAATPTWSDAPADELEDVLTPPGSALSPAEQMWRRILVGGGGLVAAMLLVAIAIWSFTGSSDSSVPPEQVAEVADVSVPDEPATGGTLEETVEEVVPPETVKPRPWFLRWAPQETEAALVVSLAKPEAAAAMQDWLEKPQLAGVETLNQCLVAFKLNLPALRDVAWSTVAMDHWAESGVIAIRLHEPVPDREMLFADAERLEIKIGEGFCYQMSKDLWPHPFALIDEHTLVTGPLDLLSELSTGGPQHFSSWAFSQLATSGEAGTVPFRVVMDTAALRGRGVDLPATWIEAWADAAGPWDVLRSLVDGVVVESQIGEPYEFRLGLLCAGEEPAAEVRRLSGQILGMAHRDIGVSLDREQLPDPDSDQQTQVRAFHDLLDRIDVRAVGSLVWLEGPLQLPPSHLLASSVDWIRHWDAARLAADDVPEPANAADGPKPDVPDPPMPENQGPAPLVTKRPPLPILDIKARLADTLVAFQFSSGRLIDLLRLTEGLSTIPIDVDVDSLARAGVSLETPVSLNLDESTIAELLEAALAPHQLTFVTGPRHLTVTAAEPPQSIRYRLSDLLGKTTAAELAAVAKQMSVPTATESVTADGANLVVEGGPKLQAAVLEFLERLRVARGQLPLASKPPALLTARSRSAAAASHQAESVTMNFFVPTPLEQITQFIESQHSVFILLDHKALATQRVTGATPLQVSVSDVPLSQVLDEIATGLELAYYWANDRTVVITSREGLAQRAELAWYPVGPALAADPSGKLLISDLKVRVLPGTWQSQGEGGTGALWLDQVSQSLFVHHHQGAQREIAEWLNARTK